MHLSVFADRVCAVKLGKVWSVSTTFLFRLHEVGAKRENLLRWATKRSTLLYINGKMDGFCDEFLA